MVFVVFSVFQVGAFGVGLWRRVIGCVVFGLSFTGIVVVASVGTIRHIEYFRKKTEKRMPFSAVFFFEALIIAVGRLLLGG